MMVPRFTSRMGLYWEAKRCPLLWIFVAKGGMMERNFVERLLILKRVFVSLDHPLSAEALIEPPVEVPATNVLSTVVINVTPGPEGKENIDASTRGDLAFSKLDDEARDAVLIFPFASCFLLLLALACFSLLHAAVPKLIPYIHSFLATSTSAVLNEGIPISVGITASVLCTGFALSNWRCDWVQSFLRILRTGCALGILGHVFISSLASLCIVDAILLSCIRFFVLVLGTALLRTPGSYVNSTPSELEYYSCSASVNIKMTRRENKVPLAGAVFFLCGIVPDLLPLLLLACTNASTNFPHGGVVYFQALSTRLSKLIGICWLLVPSLVRGVNRILGCCTASASSVPYKKCLVLKLETRSFLNLPLPILYFGDTSLYASRKHLKGNPQKDFHSSRLFLESLWSAIGCLEHRSGHIVGVPRRILSKLRFEVVYHSVWMLIGTACSVPEPSNDSVVVETSDFSQHEINSMPDGPSDPFHHPVNVDNNIQDWGRSFELSIVLFPHVVIDPMDIRPNRLRSGLVSFRSFHLSFSDSFFPALV
ncbi:hypothetical protein Tco_0641461 [Tanacetum coccineum]